ncbi:MAG: helix-turn-helix domain-containing protein [Gammaproteobacteria bacterium]|nr:helix-turn-helix domain-containing protein [Gammaproteobacteria bacterium]MDH3467210.1 helix-turn-helix domain-containing protein [Gammaproteobacteria bacterium]
MEISEQLTDEAVLTEIGERLARARIDAQLTQADLAEQAGVSKRTVERIEAGGSAQLSNIVRILRVLGRLPNLNHVLPAATPGPMELLKRKGKPRQRASTRHRVDSSAGVWSWNDDP